MTSIKFRSVKELYDEPLPTIRYLVDGLLSAVCLIMLIGKPKSGKSTLARQLIVAIATNTPFLGRESAGKGVKILYFAMEEWATEVRRHFVELGLPEDAPVETHTGALGADWRSELRARLAADSQIKLVVIDPLFLALTNIKDANDYAPMMRAIAELREIASEFEIAILCIHHSKKNQSADSGDNVLGSTAIRGTADGTWQIIKKADGTRTFETEMRYCKDVPPTVLVFDENSRRSILGSTEAGVERQATFSTRERIEEEILTRASSLGAGTRIEILAAVTGKTTLKGDIFNKLVREGELEEKGSGVKGDPHVYTVRVPVEPNPSQEQEHFDA